MTVHSSQHVAGTVKYTVRSLGCQWIGPDWPGLEMPVKWPFIAFVWTALDLVG
jgi:hypothetical protein